MVLDYKKEMYQNTDTLYIEKVINSTKKNTSRIRRVK